MATMVYYVVRGWSTETPHVGTEMLAHSEEEAATMEAAARAHGCDRVTVTVVRRGGSDDA